VISTGQVQQAVCEIYTVQPANNKTLGYKEVYFILNSLTKVKYKWRLHCASKLTRKYGCEIGGDINKIQFSSRIQELLDELSISLAGDYIPQIESFVDGPEAWYAQDCANVHVSVLQFIQAHYPDLNPILTIGSVYYKGKPRYKFNKKLITSLGELKVFDAHAWITLGNDIVFDCTISTHLNMKVYDKRTFGPILVGGINEKFQHKTLHNINTYILKDYTELVYEPILLGVDVMNIITPKRKENMYE
jgi:hypothetical protein